MWQDDKFYTDKEGKHTTASILSTEAGFNIVPTPANNIVVEVEEVSFRFARFYATNMAKDSYNPVERDLNIMGAYCVLAKCIPVEVGVDTKEDSIKKEELLGGIVCIPHTLYIETLGSVKSVLSTYLLVHGEHRHEGLAKSIIMATVKEGYARGIQLGYHWLKESKSKAAIRSLSWYRPLLPAKAAKQDYQLIKDADYTLPTIEPEYTINYTKIEDFETFASTASIRLQPTTEEFLSLSNILIFYTVKHNDIIVAILSYRPFTIIKPKITCYSVQLCYFDCLKGHAIAALTLLFQILQQKGFVAIHGVFMSQLSYTVGILKISLTPALNIDFYNLAHPGILNSGCALLYI